MSSELERWASPSRGLIPSRDERTHKKAVDRLVNETKFAGLKVDAEAALTGRIMEMQAAQSGQTKDDMLAAVPFMVGAMMAPLDVPEFASSVSSAVGRFLQTSGSITLTARPEEPVSFAELMGIGAGIKAGNVKPAEVIERFNVEISAP